MLAIVILFFANLVFLPCRVTEEFVSVKQVKEQEEEIEVRNNECGFSVEMVVV